MVSTVSLKIILSPRFARYHSLRYPAGTTLALAARTHSTALAPVASVRRHAVKVCQRKGLLQEH